jgi:hypothetical protein
MHIQTDRQTDRQTDTHTHTHTNRHIHTHTYPKRMRPYFVDETEHGSNLNFAEATFREGCHVPLLTVFDFCFYRVWVSPELCGGNVS